MLEKYTHNNILSKYSKNDQFAIVLNPKKDSASIYAKSKTDRPEKISDNIPLSELPSDLFGRRKSFPVVFNDDNKLTIVRYANLHQHTDSSLLDGIVKVPDLVKKTELYAAVTDHGNIHAFNRFYKEMKNAKKHAIIGCEVYMETPSETPRLILNKDGHAVAAPSVLNGEHLILLAENNEGLHNLFHLITESSEHFYRKPNITWKMLTQYHSGLIATSACIGGCLGTGIKEIIKCEQHPDNNEAVDVKKDNERISREFLNRMIGLFGRDSFFIELQNHHDEHETEIMNRIREIAKKYDLKTVVGIDSHYLNKEDSKIHEMWLCQQTKTTMNDPNHFRFHGDGYHVHTSEEVVNLFPNDLEALDNTLSIAERCHVDLNDDTYHMPEFPMPKEYKCEKGAMKYLRYLTREGFTDLWNSGKIDCPKDKEHFEKYVSRIQYELEVIEKMGFESYFLVVSDYIAYAKDDKVSEHLDRYFPPEYFDQSKLPPSIIKDYEIYTGSGRGSAAGSLVCMCLGITKVDPIKYDLLFERFLSPDRISMPDIDTDFEDSGREQIIEYCRVKYGADHVSRIITFGTAAAKNALKIITRVLGKSVALGNELAGYIPSIPKVTIEMAENSNPDLLEAEKDPEKKYIVDSAKRIEGVITNRGIHACGVLISDKPAVNYMPQIAMDNPNGEGKIWTTEIQGPECEELKLLKMDFLGLITLGIAHETIDLIKKNHGVDIKYDEIPLNDVETYEYLASGNTEGVFQAESDIFTKTITGVLNDVHNKAEVYRKIIHTYDRKRVLDEFGEKLFLRVSDCNALVRPGPNQYIQEYTENIIKDPELIHYDDPSMMEYLKDTGGIMLYQEQVMLLVRKMAGFSAGQSDLIRKAMGKKKRSILDEYAEYFVTGSEEKNIKGCVANGISEDVARKVWSDMEKFAGYAFNKSHAIAYSMHTVRTAWLSHYYFPEYITAVLNANIKNSDKIRFYIRVCKDRGIKILPPSINEADANFTTDGKTIRVGLASLKQIGATAEKMVDERIKRGKYTSYSDFVYRMFVNQSENSTAFSKEVLTNLIYSGCLDGIDGSSRKAKLDAVESIVKYMKSMRKDNTKKISIFDLIAEANGEDTTADHGFMYNKNTPEMDYRFMLEKENDVAGFYITGHPLDSYSKEIKKEKSLKQIGSILEALEETSKIRKIKVAALVKEVKVKRTKNGNPYWTLMIEDETGTIKATYFSSYKGKINNPDLIFKQDSVLIISGSASNSKYGLGIDIISAKECLPN